MITIKKKPKAKKLHLLNLQFGEFVKVIKKYWNTRPGLICMIYYGIRH